MSRRKMPSLLTKEDRLIWLRLNLPLRRPTPRMMVSAAYQDADRRDATLMLGAQVQPLCIVHWRPELDHWILLRGPPAGERLAWPT
jgi:hypothetical protein